MQRKPCCGWEEEHQTKFCSLPAPLVLKDISAEMSNSRGKFVTLSADERERDVMDISGHRHLERGWPENEA